MLKKTINTVVNSFSQFGEIETYKGNQKYNIIDNMKVKFKLKFKTRIYEFQINQYAGDISVRFLKIVSLDAETKIRSPRFSNMHQILCDSCGAIAFNYFGPVKRCIWCKEKVGNSDYNSMAILSQAKRIWLPKIRALNLSPKNINT